MIEYWDTTVIGDRFRSQVPINDPDRVVIGYIVDGKPAAVPEGTTEDEAREWLLRDRAAVRSLTAAIGQPAIDAIRALDAGADPVLVWRRYQEATLSPVLSEVLTLARRKDGTVTAADLAARWPGVLPSASSNRLKELERRGLLERVGEEPVEGGGRRYVYRVWGVSVHEDR